MSHGVFGITKSVFLFTFTVDDIFPRLGWGRLGIDDISWTDCTLLEVCHPSGKYKKLVLSRAATQELM